MGTSLRVVLAFVVWYFAVSVAMIYGSIWESRANPKQDVFVAFVDGSSARGTLMRNWDKSWSLATGDGQEVRFDDFQSMAWSVPKEPPGVFQSWRALVPVSLISACFVVFVLFELRPALLRRH